jgi:hypothetical protein
LSLKFTIPFLPLGCEYSDLRAHIASSAGLLPPRPPFILEQSLAGGQATRTEREKEASVGHINKCKKPQFHIFLSATPCAYSSAHAERVREIKAPRERERVISRKVATHARSAENSSCRLYSGPRHHGRGCFGTTGPRQSKH